MWVLFYTTGNGQPELDLFEVGDREHIEHRYGEVLQRSDLWAAGVAPIADATEPHWIHPLFHRGFTPYELTPTNQPQGA